LGCESEGMVFVVEKSAPPPFPRGLCDGVMIEEGGRRTILQELSLEEPTIDESEKAAGCTLASELLSVAAKATKA